MKSHEHETVGIGSRYLYIYTYTQNRSIWLHVPMCAVKFHACKHTNTYPGIPSCIHATSSEILVLTRLDDPFNPLNKKT